MKKLDQAYMGRASADAVTMRLDQHGTVHILPARPRFQIYSGGAVECWMQGGFIIDVKTGHFRRVGNTLWERACVLTEKLNEARKVLRDWRKYLKEETWPQGLMARMFQAHGLIRSWKTMRIPKVEAWQ